MRVRVAPDWLHERLWVSRVNCLLASPGGRTCIAWEGGRDERSEYQLGELERSRTMLREETARAPQIRQARQRPGKTRPASGQDKADPREE